MSEWAVLERPFRAPLSVCLAIGIAVGCLLGWIAGRWSLAHLDIRWLEWTTALGTVAAVVVAVFLALRDQVRLRHAGENSASLVAASISPNLNIACQKLRVFRAELAFGAVKTFGDACFFGTQFLAGPRLEISQEALESLVPLPNKCAQRIAKGVSLLAFAKVKIADDINLMSGHEAIPFNTEASAQWARAIDEAYTYLSAGTRVCENFADVSTPVPSPAELYGYPFE